MRQDNITIFDKHNPGDAIYTTIKGNTRNRRLVNLPVKADAIIHCAARIFVARSVEEAPFDADRLTQKALSML